MSDPNEFTKIVRDMKTPQLLQWNSGWKESSVQRLVGENELARRRKSQAEIRGWIALALSVLSLILSIVALSQK